MAEHPPTPGVSGARRLQETRVGPAFGAKMISNPLNSITL
jgi:hypothetical protein